MAEGYQATHAVPATGLPAWPIPDGNGPPAATLDPGLDIEVFERRADWAHIRCSNGWEAWIDGRNLEPLTAPTPVGPPTDDATTEIEVPAPDEAASAPSNAPVTDAPVTDAPVTDEPAAPQFTDAPPPTRPVEQPAPTPHVDAPVPTPVAAAAAPRTDAWAAGAVPATRRVALGVPQILVVVGSAIAVVAAFLPWLELSSSDFNAFDVPLSFLRDGSQDDGGLKIGLTVAVLAGLGILTAFLRPVRWFGIITGVLIAGIGLRFIQEVGPLLDDLQRAQIFEDRFDVVKYGTYVAIAGGVLALVGGILSLRQRPT